MIAWQISPVFFPSPTFSSDRNNGAKSLWIPLPQRWPGENYKIKPCFFFFRLCIFFFSFCWWDYGNPPSFLFCSFLSKKKAWIFKWLRGPILASRNICSHFWRPDSALLCSSARYTAKYLQTRSPFEKKMMSIKPSGWLSDLNKCWLFPDVLQWWWSECHHWYHQR